jgi:RNA polymerase sigma-70 factor (ECF subfamily)
MTTAGARGQSPVRQVDRRIDDGTLTQLYDEHAAVLLGYARRLTAGDEQRAEDAVQETMLRAWRHPEAFREGRGSPRAWLMTVVRNIVVDDVRARRARPTEVAGDQTERLVEPADDIEAAVQSWTVTEALTSLSPSHRAVLVATYYRGLSVAEAAEELGIPAGTVKSRTYYALRALQLALSERGVTP